MSRPQGLHVNATRSGPRYVGVCDSCGFLFPLSELFPQMQYAGNSLVWLGTFVDRKCLNVPSEFLRPALLGPEPIPPRYPRPTNYATENQGGTPPPTEPLRLSILGDDET